MFWGCLVIAAVIVAVGVGIYNILVEIHEDLDSAHQELLEIRRSYVQKRREGEE